jgi:23S rRNA (adenine2503-C2)-methyltransferase
MIDIFLQQNNLPKYRIDQFNKSYYQDFISSFDEITTYPKDLREKLKSSIPFSTLTLQKEQISKDKGTIKYLFSRNTDNKCFETVLMRHMDGRNTVCVSCMIGCPVGCAFCATGRMGFIDNLSSTEIVDQILHIARELKTNDQKITNVVFMGMGEPLLNLDNVLKAIDTITNEDKMAMSVRRITISTSGVVSKMKELLKLKYKGRLALSLHAPNQQLREKLIPIAKNNPIEELILLMKQHAARTQKQVSFEYTLIENINDSPENALELSKLLNFNFAHVNLIPYNTIENVDFQRSKMKNIMIFSEILTQKLVSNTLRVTMGDDIRAACGQLANNNLK